MTPVLALAFLALAGAAIIEVPNNPMIHDDFYIDPMWTSSMFAKYGLTKPLFEDFTSWGKSIGVEDPMVLNRMHSYYEKPSLVFFKDPSGRVISYYAHEGLDKSIPEAKSALYGMYGASDRMAINFHPDHMLGHYKTILPGQLFEPVNNIALHRFLYDIPNDEVARWANTYANKFKPRPHHNLKDLWNTYQEEDYPIIYKEPVTLDINKKYLSEGVVPYAHVSPVTGFSDVSAALPFEFGRSSIVPSASHLVSGMPFTGFSDASAAIPFTYGKSGIIPAASHLVSGMPFTGFSDAATIPFEFGRSGIVPSASHLVSGTPFTGFSDASATIPFGYGRSSIVPAASHLFSGMPFTGFRSALGVTPAVKSAAYHLVKADMPYFTAAPAAGFVDSSATSAFPLVKTAAPLIAAEPSSLSAAGFTPVHAYAAAPPATHYVATPIHAASPLFTATTPFAKAAVPCVNCLGAEHAFSPAAPFHAGAGVIPLVKTFGDVSLTPFGAADAYKSAFPVLSADPAMTYAAAPALVKAVPATYGFSGFPYKY